MTEQTPRKAPQPEWVFFAEALAWHPHGHNLTGSQTFSVVESIRDALASGRITPADLGMEPMTVSLGSQEGQMQELVTTWRLPDGNA